MTMTMNTTTNTNTTATATTIVRHVIGVRRPDGRCSGCGASGFRFEWVTGYGYAYVCMTCATVKPSR